MRQTAFILPIYVPPPRCIDMINGGPSRNRTLKNVINHIEKNYECENLIVCDAVRPLITADLIDRYFTLLQGKAAVVTAQKITDSLGSYDIHRINRDRYYLMQSPEAFNFKLLSQHFDPESPLTEITQQFPDNSKIELYFDFKNNVKLTYPADLKYLEAILKARNNNTDFSKILTSVTRLGKYLEKNFPEETANWEKTLEKSICGLLKKWQITDYNLIKTSHFGIIFLSKSIKYGDCVLKIIPPFIGRYLQERSCYQSINTSYMCSLYDFDNNCCALLMEHCDSARNVSFDKSSHEILDFFRKVIGSERINTGNIIFNSYKDILNNKINEFNFDYQKELIAEYVKKAVSVFSDTFSEKDFVLIHGDLHRYNIMEKNGVLTAIDPIGYIAPKEIDIARYIGTELVESKKNIKDNCRELINYFSCISNGDILKKALFVDIVFRLHNSLFEDNNHILTDKWIQILGEISEELLSD